MSEKLLKFLLGELTHVRIVCQGKHQDDGKPCGASFDIPLDRLANFKGMNCLCPFCHTSFLYQKPNMPGGDTVSPFFQLAYALELINGVKDRVKIEFVIPDKT